MKRFKYLTREMVVVDEIMMNGVEKYVLVFDEYAIDYRATGLDTEESALKMNYDTHKEYEDGTKVFIILNDDTGLVAGYYGFSKDDQELKVI